MKGFFLSGPVVVASIIVIYFGCRRVSHLRLLSSCYLGIACATIAAAVVGVLSSVLFEYGLGDRVRMQGFPIPLAVLVWESDRWTDFVPPRVVQYAAILANVLTFIAAVLVLITLVLRIPRIRNKCENHTLTDIPRGNV